MAKHSPNTSEYSEPHVSKDCPEKHVDQYSHDSSGTREKSKDIHHIKDPGAIKMGQQTADHHRSQKSGGSGK